MPLYLCQVIFFLHTLPNLNILQESIVTIMAGYSKIAFSGLNYIFTASLPGYKEIETAKVSSASFNTWTTLAFIESK